MVLFISYRKIRTLIIALCCIGFASRSHALIPQNVFSNYTVNADDVCSGLCIVNAGATLTISNGATATFKGHIFVRPHGRLVIDGATVLMPVDGRVVLYADDDATNGYAGADMVMRSSRISCSAPKGFWSGIEVMRNKASTPVYNESSCRSSNNVDWANKSIIERANCAIRNYNKDDVGQEHVSSGGSLWIVFTVFKNNRLALDIQNEIHTATFDPVFDFPANWNSGCSFQVVDFIVDADYDNNTEYLENPGAMVRLTNCKNVTFFSCRFMVTNQRLLNSMTGIYARNSSAGVSQYPFPGTANPRGLFSGLFYGIHAINALQTDRIWVVSQCDFHGRVDISLSGCFKPYVIYNRSYKDLTSTIYSPEVKPTSLFMENCTGYTVESNTMYHNNTATGVGIVVSNSGTAYNEIYRNFFPKDNATANQGLLLGIQSIGRNRNANATTGLKFICNDLYTTTKGRDISVVKRPFVQNQLQLGQGISNFQYDQNTAQQKSAANLYRNTDASNPTRNYYVEDGTNTQYFTDPNNPFRYRIWNTNQMLETPFRRSNFNVLTDVDQNACPKRISVSSDISAMPPYPYHDFITNIAAIEEQIAELEANPEGTEEEMGQLLTAQALLVDSIVNYYLIQYNMDTLHRTDYLDSVAMVYAHVNKGYQFKLYQASTYMGLNRMEDAIDLLNNLTGLSAAEAVEVSRVAQMYEVQKWLAENDYNWSILPEAERELVYQYEAEDQTSAGAIARSLMAQYEDRMYHSYCVVQEEGRKEIAMGRGINRNMNNLMYPNPTHNILNINWQEEGKAKLVIRDVTGNVLMKATIISGYQQIDMSRLNTGFYIASIMVNGKTKYQQKIAKF